jgi:hypothetical protein
MSMLRLIPLEVGENWILYTPLPLRLESINYRTEPIRSSLR